MTFRKEKFVPFGGPDGGDGGVGGCVFLKATEEVLSLAHLVMTPELRAEEGGNGRRANKIGRAGSDIEVQVPVGTLAVIRDGEASKTVDMDVAERRELVCDGGGGGRGNRAFATAVMKVPRMAEVGEEGESREVSLNYKMPCHVAIIGEANAGKSSLLNRLTGAGAKVGDYWMTTVDPILGVMEWEWVQYRVVEIPATWTGSAGSVGKSLKHAHRSSVLVILLDGTEEGLVEAYRRVTWSLAQKDAFVARKSRVVVVNKADGGGSGVANQELRVADCPGARALQYVSSATGEGIEELKSTLAGLVKDAERQPEEEPEAPVQVLRPKPIGRRISVVKESGTYVVHAGALERLVRGTDISDWEARMQLMSLLEKAGVHQALQKAGVREGDTVRIGAAELEWT